QVPSFKDKEELESIEKIIKAELEEDLIFENEVVLWTDEVYKQLELIAKLVKKPPTTDDDDCDGYSDEDGDVNMHYKDGDSHLSTYEAVYVEEEYEDID
ncbi:hypothetical protein C2G38_2209447, partial [Gigaspora rosea]